MFTGGEGVDGKVFKKLPFQPCFTQSFKWIRSLFWNGQRTNPQVYNCSKVRDLLGWKPAFASFRHFMELQTKI